MFPPFVYGNDLKNNIMKFKYILVGMLCYSVVIKAQVPEDALRLSWLQQSGTARNQAVGGAMGSLGGDITATFVNPAGLGLYKVGELVLTPGFNFMNNKSDYRENTSTDKGSAFSFGTTGIVFGMGNRNSNWKSSAFSLAVNRTANFNNNVFYQGQNDYSSYSEQFAEEFASSKVDINDNLDQFSPLSIGTRMAVYTYLIDIDTINGNPQVVGLPEFLDNLGQSNLIESSGGITELALGLAGNKNDKFYIGGSLGLPIVNYKRIQTFTESDISGDRRNGFNRSTLREIYATKGIGVNAKLGLIFKPVEYVRVGLAVHTPSWYGLKDTYYGEMSTDAENQNPNLISVTGETVNGNIPVEYNYDLTSPWKFLLSGSYVFREVEDVTKQKGFISADVEYINYAGSAYQTAEGNQDDAYYQDINNTMDEIYASAFNFKVGGELKFNTIMARAGFSYYGNPYADNELKADKKFISGGIGYRDKGVFVDVTYVHGLQKDINFPYRLADKANTFAAVKGNGGNVLMTVGFKF